MSKADQMIEEVKYYALADCFAEDNTNHMLMAMGTITEVVKPENMKHLQVLAKHLNKGEFPSDKQFASHYKPIERIYNRHAMQLLDLLGMIDGDKMYKHIIQEHGDE